VALLFLFLVGGGWETVDVRLVVLFICSPVDSAVWLAGWLAGWLFDTISVV